MKRSEINKAISTAIRYFDKASFPLPPFAHWTLPLWKKNKKKADEAVTVRLGWDVTDFGLGDFKNMGRTIFTLRNGFSGSDKYYKPYSQKVMYLMEGQRSPVHYHKNKMEDIINHFGGNIIIRLWQKTSTNKPSQAKVTYSMDGIRNTTKAGDSISLQPGQSICIKPGTFHQFWAERGKDPVVSVEVSSVNDDLKDNFWLKDIQRFTTIEEDEPRQYLLCNEYQFLMPKAKKEALLKSIS